MENLEESELIKDILQENYKGRKTKPRFGFVDLEKAFDRALRIS